MSDDIQIIHRSLERERLARKKAESLLELREAELLDRHHELTTVVSIMRGQMEMLEEAINAITMAIVTLEVDGTIRLFNRHAQRLFGLSAEEVLGTSFRSMMPQVFSRDDARRLRDDLLLGQVTNVSNAHGRRKDGTSFAVNMKCCTTVKKDRRRLTLLISPPERNEKPESNSSADGKRQREEAKTDVQHATAGELLKFLAGYGQLRAKQRTDSADELIHRIDSMVGALIHSTFEGGVPDELFLHALPTSPPRVEEQPAPVAEEQPVAVSASESTERPKRRKKLVVNARSQCSHRVVRKQADVNHMLETAIEDAKERWSSFAELSADLHPELPTIPGDRKALVRVFQGLLNYCAVGIEAAIGNKTEYERGQIDVATCFDEQKIEIRICDDGAGLMSVAQCRVPATNGDEEVDIQQGLADCQAIVNDTYDGQFAVRTAPNDGTTFELSIPLNS